MSETNPASSWPPPPDSDTDFEDKAKQKSPYLTGVVWIDYFLGIVMGLVSYPLLIWASFNEHVTASFRHYSPNYASLGAWLFAFLVQTLFYIKMRQRYKAFALAAAWTAGLFALLIFWLISPYWFSWNYWVNPRYYK